MRLLVFLLLLVFTGDLPAQFWPYTPQHTYESFYMKYRREQFKTKLSDYELTGKVRSVRWTYEAAENKSQDVKEQQLVFSPGGLLTNFVIGDTTGTKEKSYASHYAESWVFHHNAKGLPDTVRIGKIRGDHRSEYWLAYDSAGYMSSTGQYDVRNKAQVKIHYKYAWYDSVFSVTTSPFEPYDITGNSIGDTVHFTFDKNGYVQSERVFWGWGSANLLMFSWQNENYFTYSIEGRSYMMETGTWKTNASGQLVAASSSGYHIDQQGTHGFDTQDSLVYTDEGWLKAEYNDPPGLPLTAENIFRIPVQPQPASDTSRMKLYRRYEYTLDNNGNWIERKHFDGSGKLIGTERRTLIYY